MVGTSEVSQQVKALGTKPNDLGSIPEIHMVEGENRLPKVAF